MLNPSQQATNSSEDVSMDNLSEAERSLIGKVRTLKEYEKVTISRSRENPELVDIVVSSTLKETFKI
jgi:hypothetical protein